MREFQAKKRIRRILYSKFTIAVLIVLVLFGMKAVWGVFKKERESARLAAEAAASYRKLEDRQRLLASELERLKTDEGIEEEIRSKYSVSKSGENVIVLVDRAEATDTATTTRPGWWERFKRVFR